MRNRRRCGPPAPRTDWEEPQRGSGRDSQGLNGETRRGSGETQRGSGWRMRESRERRTEERAAPAGSLPLLNSALLGRSGVSDSLQPHELWPSWLLCPWNFPNKILEWVAISLPRVFLTQGLNSSLLHWQVDSLPLSHR